MEATIENLEGAGIPDDAGDQIIEGPSQELQFVDNTIEVMQAQDTYMQSEAYNSNTDIHEINRKLEEIANLDNSEELHKSDEVICDSSVEQVNIVPQSEEIVEQVNDSSQEINVPTDVETVTPTEEEQCTNQEDVSQEDLVAPLETSTLDVSLSNDEMETSIPVVSEGVSIENMEVEGVGTDKVKQQPSEVAEVENSNQETVDAVDSTETVDPAELVEDQIMNLVGADSDVGNESLDTNKSVESVESVQDCKIEVTDATLGGGETIILSSDQIEISEIEPNEVITAEEVHVEYTVVEEDCEDSKSKLQSRVNTFMPEQHSIDTGNDNSAPSEEVYVQDFNQSEEHVTQESSQDHEAGDNELFIVTREPEETDPLQTAETGKQDKPKKQRGRKTTNAIPSHVLGVDINNPAADINGTGRLKPRLGVKVPYRNLSSQIVSKKEIEDEIMERFRQKQAQQAVEKSDLLFARKLTQRLASKIVPDAVTLTPVTLGKANTKSSTPLKLNVSSARIEKDSDLLAILEGDDDDVRTVDEATVKKEREEAERKVKLMEREIALKQLKDLPNTPPSIVKPGRPRSEVKIHSENSKSVKTSSNSRNSDSLTHLTKPKSRAESSHSVKKIDVEPQLKPAMVLKTYSRKRKSVDLEAILSSKKPLTSEQKSDRKSPENDESEKSNEHRTEKKPSSATETKGEKKISNPTDQKSDTTTPDHPYVTKSSRVIKKKVIWDPDEVILPRPLIKSPKPGDTPGASKQTTPVSKPVTLVSKQVTAVSKSVDKKPSNDKSIEKKVTLEKKAIQEKKPVEKKQVVSPEKRSPKKSVSPKKGKRLSEIDRLLMDEGAVNMLYEVKNTEDAQSKFKKKTKTVISIEKAEKEIRNKANELLKDLKQNTNQEDVHKSLRRKESPPEFKKEITPTIVSRKMSKDSSRSSVHSPPASPAFSYEASRIIRRHSSSSFSSGEEATSDSGDRVSKKRSATSGAVQKVKRIKKAVDATPVIQKTKISDKDNFVAPKDTSSVPVPKPKEATEDSKPVAMKMTSLKRVDKVITIKLNYGDGEAYLSVQILKEINATLNRLAKDPNCHGVIITSSGSNYCLGLNYKLLVADTEEARKKKATELATQVRDFLKCLLHFPKVLIAGVQGDCIGLGVTMLSLFDMVIASDKAQFSMPYGRFGCVPEAAFLLTVPHLIGHGLASELYYTSSKLSASEVARHGLVTRLCWPEKYSDELKSVSSSISQQNMQSIQEAKKQLRQNLLQTTEAAINSQMKTLIEHWISDECQNNFANFKMDMK